MTTWFRRRTPRGDLIQSVPVIRRCCEICWGRSRKQARLRAARPPAPLLHVHRQHSVIGQQQTFTFRCFILSAATARAAEAEARFAELTAVLEKSRADAAAAAATSVKARAPLDYVRTDS